jgi:hypothetical protein
VDDPRITSTILGFTKESALVRTPDALDVDLPAVFWREIEDAVPAPEDWLDHAEPTQVSAPLTELQRNQQR